jgi:hypothetical protein
MHAYSILNRSTGTQILKHEETTQLSPSTVHKVSTYESRRNLGSGQRTYSPHSTYEVIGESGLKILSPKTMSASSDIGEGYARDILIKKY